MRSWRTKVMTLALFVASLLVMPAVVSASNGPARSVPDTRGSTQPLENVRASETSSAPASESAAYAKRETAANSLQDFKGGEAGVYIGGSAVGVVLVILLLVILL